MVFLPDLLRCPRCGGPIQKSEPRLQCGSCGAAFASGGRFVDFRAAGDTTEDWTAFSDGKALLWPRLVREHVARARNRRAALYESASAGRAAFRILLDLHPDAAVLEIGGGTGLVASGIARLGPRVVMAESAVEPARLALRRFEIHNPSDAILLVLVDPDERLPLRNSTFDCVVISRGLDWTAGSVDRGSSGVDPADQLREVRRVLKPGGQLFWIADNRFSYLRRWRFPAREPHALSFLQYRGRLREAGFERVSVYGLLESPTHFGGLRPLAFGPSAWKPKPARGWKNRVKRNRLLAPRYGILAEIGPGSSGSSLGHVLDEVARGLEADLTVRDFRVSRKDKAILTVSAGSADVMVRIPLSPAGTASDERNARMLLSVGRHERLRSLVPESLARGRAGGHAYFVESRVPGRPLGTLLRRVGFATMAERARVVMDALNPSIGTGEREALDGARYEEEVSNRIEALEPLLEDPRWIGGLRDYFEKEVRGLRLPTGIAHGDLSLSNLFVADDGELTGLIDWEGAADVSLPVLDAIHFVESHHRAITGDRLGWATTRLAARDFADHAHEVFLSAVYERMGLAAENHAALVHLKWVRHIAYLASFWLAYSAEGIRDFVNPVVSSILESPSARPRSGR